MGICFNVRMFQFSETLGFINTSVHHRSVLRLSESSSVYTSTLYMYLLQNFSAHQMHSLDKIDNFETKMVIFDEILQITFARPSLRFLKA